MINDLKSTYKPYTLNKVENSNIILLCDHASQYIPSEYKDLGISEKLKNEHISYDIGAANLTAKISEIITNKNMKTTLHIESNVCNGKENLIFL